jgi:hypothetical protein
LSKPSPSSTDLDRLYDRMLGCIRAAVMRGRPEQLVLPLSEHTAHHAFAFEVELVDSLDDAARLRRTGELTGRILLDPGRSDSHVPADISRVARQLARHLAA